MDRQIIDSQKDKQMKAYKFKINGKSFDVSVNGIEGSMASVTVNGKDYQVELENRPAETVTESVTVQTAPVVTKAVGDMVSKVVKAPLPGVIIDMCVREGQHVHRGQKLAVLEAMKMENEILCEMDGIVKELFVHKGDSVLEGAKIASIG